MTDRGRKGSSRQPQNGQLTSRLGPGRSGNQASGNTNQASGNTLPRTAEAGPRASSQASRPQNSSAALKSEPAGEARGRRAVADPARRLAFAVLRRVSGQGAYAQVALAEALAAARLDRSAAALATELVAGTCRLVGVYDQVLERAGGRKLTTLQPAVVDLLRLGAHQLLSLRKPAAVAVSTTVELARETVGPRVTGVVNAILRRVAAHSWEGWTELLGEGRGPVEQLALASGHPAWIAQVYVDLLGFSEAAEALAANNEPAPVTLALRPGLATIGQVLGEIAAWPDEAKRPSASSPVAQAGGMSLDGDWPAWPAVARPGRWSPFAIRLAGDPGQLEAVRQGRVGVQDEGSQLAAWALTWPGLEGHGHGRDGAWLDLCAGPGGKTALLAGLARRQGASLVANEVVPHRAELTRQALRAYGSAQDDPASVAVQVGDGRCFPGTAEFSRVLVDVPCTGLGALRRRPDARWRKTPDDLPALTALQRGLLDHAFDLVRPGGVVAYVTCSPHPAETVDVVAWVLAHRPEAAWISIASVAPTSLAGLFRPEGQTSGEDHGESGASGSGGGYGTSGSGGSDSPLLGPGSSAAEFGGLAPKPDDPQVDRFLNEASPLTVEPENLTQMSRSHTPRGPSFTGAGPADWSRPAASEFVSPSVSLDSAVPGSEPMSAVPPWLQLWPQRHGTDAMFIALLRRRLQP